MHLAIARQCSLRRYKICRPSIHIAILYNPLYLQIYVSACYTTSRCNFCLPRRIFSATRPGKCLRLPERSFGKCSTIWLFHLCSPRYFDGFFPEQQYKTAHPWLVRVALINGALIKCKSMPESLWTLPTFRFQRIRWCFSLRYVNYAVNIEGHVLCICRPMLVTKAIREFAIMAGCEWVISVWNWSLMCLITSIWILNLLQY